MTVALPLAPVRVPSRADQHMRCEAYAATILGGVCVQRQRAVVKAGKTYKPDNRFAVCNSGKCEQGNAVMRAIGNGAGKRVESIPTAGGTRQVREATQASFRAKGLAVVAKVEARLAARAALPAPSAKGNEPTKEEATMADKRVCRHEGCGFVLGANNKSGLCAWHASGSPGPRPEGWTSWKKPGPNAPGPRKPGPKPKVSETTPAAPAPEAMPKLTRKPYARTAAPAPAPSRDLFGEVLAALEVKRAELDAAIAVIRRLGA